MKLERPVKMYLARGMTGRIKAEVVAEASVDRRFFNAAGFEVLCPVTEEGVKKEKKILNSTRKEMDTYWKRDKEMIREADIVIDMTPNLLSQGVIHELGLARYCYWKPVVRIFAKGTTPSEGSVAHYEDDVVVDSREEAVEAIYRLWGTPSKRLKWRLAMLNRSLGKWIGFQWDFFWGVF